MIVDLAEKLKLLEQDSDLPAEKAAKIDRINQELANSGKVDGLKEGTKAPDFAVPDHAGKEVVLSEELADGPMVLAFYRGKW
mgnify:FL=1